MSWNFTIWWSDTSGFENWHQIRKSSINKRTRMNLLGCHEVSHILTFANLVFRWRKQRPISPKVRPFIGPKLESLFETTWLITSKLFTTLNPLFLVHFPVKILLPRSSDLPSYIHCTSDQNVQQTYNLVGDVWHLGPTNQRNFLHIYARKYGILVIYLMSSISQSIWHHVIEIYLS